MRIQQQASILHTAGELVLAPKVGSTNSCAGCVGGCTATDPFSTASAGDPGTGQSVQLSVNAPALTQTAALVFGLPLLTLCLLGYWLAEMPTLWALQSWATATIVTFIFLLGFGFVAALCRFVAKPLERRLALSIER